MKRQEEICNSTIDILERAKGFESDEELSKKLGVKRSSISVWRNRGHIGALYTAKLAEMAGVEIKEALAICAAEAEQTEEGREYLFKRLQGGLVQSALLYPIIILGALGAFILCKIADKINHCFSTWPTSKNPSNNTLHLNTTYAIAYGKILLA